MEETIDITTRSLQEIAALRESNGKLTKDARNMQQQCMDLQARDARLCKVTAPVTCLRSNADSGSCLNTICTAQGASCRVIET